MDVRTKRTVKEMIVNTFDEFEKAPEQEIDSCIDFVYKAAQIHTSKEGNLLLNSFDENVEFNRILINLFPVIKEMDVVQRDILLEFLFETCSYYDNGLIDEYVCQHKYMLSDDPEWKQIMFDEFIEKIKRYQE